jgi:predicted MFS family arabinose efflux permease
MPNPTTEPRLSARTRQPAVVTDGRALVVLLSRVTRVTATAPLLAPVAGAELLPHVGWRGIFAVLAVASAAVLLAAVLLVPETHPRTTGPAHLRSRLRAVCSDRAWCDTAWRMAGRRHHLTTSALMRTYSFMAGLCVLL